MSVVEGLLARTRAALHGALEGPKKSEGQRLLFVFGNEAGDVDSLVSAVCLAHWWSRAPAVRHLGCSAVPVAPFPRAEFRLRGDARRIFRQADVEFDDLGAPRNLVFADELEDLLKGEGKGESKGHCAALTDHNELSARMGAMLRSAAADAADVEVLAVVDHHRDAKRFLDAPVRVVDEGCGSACTLVAEMLLDLENSLEAEEQTASAAAEGGETLPEAVAHMLLSAMLVDTRNFNEESHRFNERDVTVHARLCGHARLGPALPDGPAQATLFGELMDARHDVSALNAGDLLRLDFKSAVLTEASHWHGNFGFASIMGKLDELLERAGSVASLEAELDAFAAQHSLSCVVCFCAAEKRGKGKDKCKALLIRSTTGTEAGDAVADALRGAPANLPASLLANPLYGNQGIVDEGFGFEPRPFEGATSGTNAFYVRRQITRKTLMPAVLQVLESQEA